MQTLNILSKKINVSKGFVGLVDCMPRVIPNEASQLKCDYAIVQAARVSVGEGIKDFETDSKLIDFLLRHSHTSPFEMVRFKFHVKAPIFVVRQWFRHRMANVNEISGRYSVLPNEFYIPENLHKQNKGNKQMSGDVIDDNSINLKLQEYMGGCREQYFVYDELVKHGVARETARIGLPMNLYTEFYWCIDLHNLLNFIRLREAKNAQPEIREYASSIKELIKDLCPVTLKSFDNHITNSVKFSQSDCENITILNNGYSRSKELQEKISIVNNTFSSL
jgi:thymidylate synthase (FAD)